ncbi:MAG: hypothetical protein RLZ97_1791 [Verrucomicrobiota bacterium]
MGVRSMSMRQLLAILLLTCFGMMLPAAAVPVRVCILERALVAGGGDEDRKCCPDCNRGEPDHASCCLDLEGLPDTSAPQPMIELPPLIAADLPADTWLSPVVTELGRKAFSASEPIRGPTSPAAYRAVLGIWRL